MISIGINGFGRIGKCVFIQLINLLSESKQTNENKIIITAINAPGFDIKHMETYLKYDSVHKYNHVWKIEMIDSENFSINGIIIHVFQNRDAKQLDWKKYGINYVIDATGSYLTTAKTKDHNVDYVILCAPPKDKTPLFVYKVNDEKYNGENIVSNASCTTNCITPVLKFLDDKYGIKNGNFTTIHSTTASQTTVDILNSSNRTHRSILNNIIPHSTGASGAISELIPSLTNKIYGTSLRVPVSNVSLVDLNVELEKDISFEELIKDLENDDFIEMSKINLVSCDFITTTCPSIVDQKASMHLGENRFKLMIWYDNEWSYSAQVIKLLERMIHTNNIHNVNLEEPVQNKFFIDNFNFCNKKVILRVDWNIPTKNFKIQDDFRITSSLKTVQRILKDSPERIVIISHFGRPDGKTDKYSWKHYIEQIQSYFYEKIEFLEDGLSESTLERLDNYGQDGQNIKNKLFLLENIRFHDQETNYKKYDDNNLEKNIISKLGDFYVNDAFGCCHRDHLSICGINTPEKAFGYLINDEINALKILMENKTNQKILAIIGGAKMDDKLPLVESLSKKMNDIYLGGGNINTIIKKDMVQYLNRIGSNKAKIHLMKDGLCATGLDTMPSYSNSQNLDNDKYFFDIGMESILELEKLIEANDIIFINGMMGVTEHSLYKIGSETLVKLLIKSGKKVIVAGGDSVGFVNQYEHNFFYVSTGGGSSIDYISNGSLVGIDFFQI